MIAPDHIPTNSASNYGAFKTSVLTILACVLSVFLSACATGPITLPTQLEAHPQAITIPYRISEAGLIIVDMSVNGHAAKPFIIDSGANATAIYESHLKSFGVTSSGKFSSVSGLVATAIRPVAENVDLQIGSKNFRQRKIVILETPVTETEAVGLIGVDVLGDYAVVFCDHFARSRFHARAHRHGVGVKFCQLGAGV